MIAEAELRRGSSIVAADTRLLCMEYQPPSDCSLSLLTSYAFPTEFVSQLCARSSVELHSINVLEIAFFRGVIIRKARCSRLTPAPWSFSTLNPSLLFIPDS